MFEYLLLIVVSVILLCLITVMSFTGFTIYDAVIFTNYNDSTTLINNKIEDYIHETTSNNILVKTKDGYHFKTAKISYDVRTDLITMDDLVLPLSSNKKLAFFFLPVLKKTTRG